MVVTKGGDEDAYAPYYICIPCYDEAWGAKEELEAVRDEVSSILDDAKTRGQGKSTKT